MQIYIHRDNQQLGPFTEAEIKAQLASGAISLQDNAWWEGQTSWVPLGQTPYGAAVAAPTPAVPVAQARPAVSARPVVQVSASVSASSAASPSGEAKTSVLAICSLIAGILFCLPFASLAAVILGHLGLSAIKKNPNLKGRGMALSGTILGYVFLMIGIIYFIVVLVFLGGNFPAILSQIQAQQAAAAANQGADTTPAPAPDNATPAPAPAPAAPANQ